MMFLRTTAILSLLWLAGCAPAPSILPPEEILPRTETALPKEASPPEVHSAIPLKTLPRGWTLNRELIAKWGTSLPAVLGVAADSLAEVEYWDDFQTLAIGLRLPIKRAKVSFENVTRLTVERIELRFVNVDHVYSVTNHEASHYILDGVSKRIGLKSTGFPQVTADDVLKHKILLSYGTPREFDGVWHHYQDDRTVMKVRVADDLHLQVQLIGAGIIDQLYQAIEEVYSEEGIELKKQQLMEGFDI